MFTTYVGGNFGRVKMSNKDVTEVVGIENVNLVIDIGSELVLKDVRQFLDVQLRFIISVGKLDNEGHSNYFGEGRWKFTKGSLIIAKCQKMNSLYLTHVMLSSGR